MAGGRPTKYTPELLEKAQEYLDSVTEWRIEQKEVPTKMGVKTINEKKANPMPSISALCYTLGISRDTAHRWDKEHEQFSDILNQLRVKQEMFLINHGLTDGYNASFAKFIMTNVTKFRDKQEVEHKADSVNITYSMVEDDD